MILKNLILGLSHRKWLIYIHQTNIQTLSLEMYKVKHNLHESYLKDLFSAVNSHYNLQSQCDFRIPGVYFLQGIHFLQLGILHR